jgi:hypothetical protein
MDSHLKPHKLLDHIKKEFKIKTDKDLAGFLETNSPVMSRFRNGYMRLTPDMLVAIHEATGWPLQDIRDLYNEHLISTHKNRGKRGYHGNVT